MKIYFLTFFLVFITVHLWWFGDSCGMTRRLCHGHGFQAKTQNAAHFEFYKSLIGLGMF